MRFPSHNGFVGSSVMASEIFKEETAQLKAARAAVASSSKLLKTLRRDFKRAKDNAALTNIQLAIDAAEDRWQKARGDFNELQARVDERRAETRRLKKEVSDQARERRIQQREERQRLAKLPKPPKLPSPLTPEHRQKISEAHKDTAWFHDPITLINSRHKVDDAPPHLVRGRAPGSIKNHSYPTTFTNPTTYETIKVYLRDGEEPPDGYEQGTPTHFRALARRAKRAELRLKQGPTEAQLEHRNRMRWLVAGKKWWHHEVTKEQRRFTDDETPPDGFVLGRLSFERGPDKKPRKQTKRPGGNKVSPEGRARMRASMLRSRALRAQTETAEEREFRLSTLSASQRGLVWWFNTETGNKTRARYQPGPDWARGTGKAPKPKQQGPGIGMPGHSWFHDPATGTKGRFLPGTEPDGFVRGAGGSPKQSEALRGRRWFHLPATNHQAQFHPGSEPDGYVRGKAPKT